MAEPPPSYTDAGQGGQDSEEAPPDMSFNKLNYPNELESIPDAEFNADRANVFIAFNPSENRLRIENRAFPLLRSPLPPADVIPKPGFISFIGETGSGKSWIIRALKRKEDHSRYPPPLVAPGRTPNRFASTSADVHLYADSASSESENPILFLDFEGLNGTTVPSSLTACFGVMSHGPRYDFVQQAYPRIAYAFSNCIIYVANELNKAEDITTQLTAYSNSGVQGSRHLGFKPALFVVFNRIPIRDWSPSAWSVEDNTAAFLALQKVDGLEEHYHKIFVIKIPQLTSKSTNLVIGQLEKLDCLLREQHSEACNRRIGFKLDFTPDKITRYLTQALQVFTNRKDTVFDWLEQTFDQRELPYSTKIAEEKWIQFFRHFRDSDRLSPVKAFQDAREAFYSHVIFCIHLHLARHPLVGRTVGAIPRVLQDDIRHVDQAISCYVPCGGAKDGFKCEGLQQRHDNDFHACGAKRWRGAFLPAVKHEHSLRAKVLDSLATCAPLEKPNFSIKDSKNIAVLSKIRSVYSCAGCFTYPSTILSCEHAFCEDCVADIASGKDLHRLDTIKCPFCHDASNEHHFSPRFLPHTAGYRILSLDGGGVRGIAQIKILREIEKRCFDIPVIHLFDFLIGTSIGGQLILAFASRASPLTLSNAETAFRDLLAKGFKPKKFFGSSAWHLFTALAKGSTKYKSSALDAHLKDFFQEFPRILSANNPQSPHVAVTAASRDGFQKRLIPNYLRRAVASDKEKRRLVLSPEPKNCMPTWVAARCTAAAYPYFKGFEWNGEYLLDGGFVVNCPAELAVEEARCIWPNRRMDTLVSIGTGASTDAARAKNRKDEDLLKIAETAVQVVVSSEKLWAEFQTRHTSDKERIFRFQPVYSQIFPLDAVNKLEFICQDVERWLTTQRAQIDDTSNQLIASLFFFKPSVLDRQSGTQTGSIECRLPPGFFARPAMINALIKVAPTRRLFTVDIPGRGSSGEPFRWVLRFLEDLSPDAELSFPVTFDHLPVVGRSTIDIKLCGIFGNGESRYSISGCPFTIGE